MNIAFLALMLIPFSIAAQVVAPLGDHMDDMSTTQISQDYYSGRYLIYDCLQKAWMCVDEDGYRDCQKKRKQSMEAYDVILACAPVLAFKKSSYCVKRQRIKIGSPETLDFCIHPERRI